jgi:hypothetical protein
MCAEGALSITRNVSGEGRDLAAETAYQGGLPDGNRRTASQSPYEAPWCALFLGGYRPDGGMKSLPTTV